MEGVEAGNEIRVDPEISFNKVMSCILGLRGGGDLLRGYLLRIYSGHFPSSLEKCSLS